jgi:hypothetical protein
VITRHPLDQPAVIQDQARQNAINPGEENQ